MYPFAEHSLVQTPTSSFSDNLYHMKIEEKPSETNISIEDNKTEQEQEDVPTKLKSEESSKEEKESEMQTECEQIKLVFSEVHLVSISNTRTSNKNKKTKNTTHLDEPIVLVKDSRYSTFLKFFYLIFYTLVYFCMTVMNFSC